MATTARAPESRPSHLGGVIAVGGVLFAFAVVMALAGLLLGFASDACGSYGPTCNGHGLDAGVLVAFVGPLIVAAAATVVGSALAKRRRRLPFLVPALGFPAVILVWMCGAITVSIATSVPLDVLL